MPDSQRLRSFSFAFFLTLISVLVPGIAASQARQSTALNGGISSAELSCVEGGLHLSGVFRSVDDVLKVCVDPNGCESDSNPDEGYSCTCGADSGSDCSCNGNTCTCLSGDGESRVICETRPDGGCLCSPSGVGEGIYCKAGIPIPGKDTSCFCAAGGPNPACRRDGRYVTCMNDDKETNCRLNEDTGECECFTS